MLLQFKGGAQFEHAAPESPAEPQLRQFFGQKSQHARNPLPERLEDHQMVADQPVFPTVPDIGAAPGNTFDHAVLFQRRDHMLRDQKRDMQFRGEIPRSGQFASRRKAPGFDPVQQELPAL